MRVELTRVRVKEDKSAHVDDWLKMLNDVVMLPPRIAQARGWENPPADVVPFERREIVHRPPE
jgi:Family of unknown function (DUF6176)